MLPDVFSAWKNRHFAKKISFGNYGSKNSPISDMCVRNKTKTNKCAETHLKFLVITCFKVFKVNREWNDYVCTYI